MLKKNLITTPEHVEFSLLVAINISRRGGIAEKGFVCNTFKHSALVSQA
jgi:hypothetical protein